MRYCRRPDRGVEKVMPHWVSFLGLLMALAGVVLLFRPTVVGLIVERVGETKWFYPALMGRLLIGAALIAAAPGLPYANLVALLGWFTVTVALSLIALPRTLSDVMLDGFRDMPPWGVRMLSLVGLSLGLFLVFVGLL